MRTFTPCCTLLAIVSLVALSSATASAPPAAAAKQPPTALPADLALVPANADLFLCLEVAAHWNGPEAGTLKRLSEAHPIIVTSWAQDLDRQVGLKLGDVERAVLVIPDFKAPDAFAAILTARQPLERAKVLGALVPEAREVKVGAKTYYVSDKSGLGVQVVNERVLLVGTAEGVKTFLTRPPAEGGALRSAVAAAAGKHLLVAGINPNAFRAAVQNAGEDAKPFLPLFEAKSWQITVDANKDLRIKFRLDFPTEAAAREGRGALQRIVPPLAGYFELVEQQMPAFAKQEEGKYKNVSEATNRLVEVSKIARAALKDFNSEEQGTVVRGTLHLKTDEPATAFVLLVSLMPRSKKK